MTRIIKKSDGCWWIVDLPANTPDCGPYDKKYGLNSATEDLEGLERFFLFHYVPPKKKILVKRKKLT